MNKSIRLEGADCISFPVLICGLIQTGGYYLNVIHSCKKHEYTFHCLRLLSLLDNGT